MEPPKHQIREGGCAILDEDLNPLPWPYESGIGRAACSCGEVSEVLWRQRQRISWFSAHRLEVAENQLVAS